MSLLQHVTLMKKRTQPLFDDLDESPDAVTMEASAQGRDEMNLAEFPITVLADRVPRGTKTLIFHAGQGQLTITGSDAYGLPTALDADVIIALVQLTKLRNNFKSPRINFTRYELLRLLGWNNEGRNYRRLDESLQRWVGVTLNYDNCWWDNRSKRYGNATLHILESVVILEGKARSDESGVSEPLPLSTFTWNRVFLDSCQADNLKQLDVSLYFSLQHAASKRLYRFLDKRFYHRPRWTFELAEIAFDRVGLSRSYARNVAKIKEKLQPAIDELEEVGFLVPRPREERYVKEVTGWKVHFERHLPPLFPPEPDDDEQLATLVSELVKRGVTRNAGVGLAQTYPRDRICEKIEIFDWMVERSDRRITKSPSGWLVKAIEDDYALPKGFVRSSERLRQQEARHDRELRAAEESRKRQDTRRRQELARRSIDSYLARLDPEARAALEREVLSRATEEVRQNYENPALAKFRATIMSELLHEYLASRVKKGEPSLLPI